jgi:hypothetical protein
MLTRSAAKQGAYYGIHNWNNRGYNCVTISRIHIKKEFI